MTGDLFGAALLPRLSTFDGLISVSEADALTAASDNTHLAPFRFQQWTGKRLTSSFGMSYDFEGDRLEPAPAMPDWLLSVRERAAKRAGLVADEFVQALLICYDPGAGIGWHRDRMSSNISSAYRSARRLRCGSGGASGRGSSAPPFRCRLGAATA